MVSRVDGLLYLIRENPTLCPPVDWQGGEGTLAVMMWERGQSGHICLACGGTAEVALVAGTKDGKRWLDLCMPDYAEVQGGNVSDQPFAPEEDL